MRMQLLTAILLVATTGCGGTWLGLGGSSAPRLQGTADTDLIAYSEVVHDRLAAVEDCTELHALVLGVADSVRSVLGDELALPSHQDVTGEQLTHAGGLGLSMIAANPATPYGRWADGPVVLAQAMMNRVDFQDPEAEEDPLVHALDALPPATGGAAMVGGPSGTAERYDELGCGLAGEAAALSRFLGLPNEPVERDLAAMAAVADQAENVSSVVDLTLAQEIEFAALVRLLDGPSLPDDDTTLPALAELVVDATGELDDPTANGALAVLPHGLDQHAQVFRTDDGTCANVHLREQAAYVGIDPPSEPVVAQAFLRSLVRLEKAPPEALDVLPDACRG